MVKRRTKSRSTKKNNSFTIFLVVVIILALVSFAISYFVIQTDSEIVKDNTNIEVPNTKPAIIKETVKQNPVLDGTWASYNDGAMLTITGHKFSIELPSVESTILASGTLEVVDNTVTFVYTNNNSNCGTTAGVYRFIVVNEEVTFVKDSDSCGSRVGLLVATWFKV